MNASPEEVFNAFVDPAIIEQWSGSPAEMDANTGKEFKLWGGSIWGTNLEVIPGQKLVQEWWDESFDAASKVTFTLKPDGNGTIVEMVHEDIPDAEYDNIDNGWRDYYLGPMQGLFEKE